MSTNAIQRALQVGPNERRWRDLRSWRLCLGLTLGPIACAILIFLIEMLDSGITATETKGMLVAFIFFGVIWQMVAGWAYLLLVVRTRGRIGRSECLLLGIALMLLLPAVIFSIVLSDPESGGMAEALAGFTPPWILISLGMFLIFGLVSGGVLWRFGVRPAKTPVAASASVFE